MNKSELIYKLAARFPQLVAKDADFAVKMILDAMMAALERGDRTEIRGFGSFDLNYRPPRTGRNPKSGEKVKVAAKYVPHFKAGTFRSRVVDLLGMMLSPWGYFALKIDQGLRSAMIMRRSIQASAKLATGPRRVVSASRAA